jgi:DNA polymerase
MTRKHPGGDARTTTVQRLESLAQAGVKQLGRRDRKTTAKVTPEPAAANPPQAAEPKKSAAAVAKREPASPLPSSSRVPPPASGHSSDSLSIIQAEVAACALCDELASTRTQTVFGVGNPKARLCFLGEAPGADEDRQGEPFVGRAGQLLTKIIEACTLNRSDVYILNVLKCRPPGNRTPLPHEVENCRGFLDRQLALIQPEYICCLGAVAAQTLLQTETTIGRLRGTIHDYRGIGVLCTYHPAYLLRNPAAKKDVWEDMKILMAKMGIPLP